MTIKIFYISEVIAVKRKKLFICAVAILSFNMLSISPLFSKQASFNAVKSNTNKMICGDKTTACPVNIHSVRPNYI